MSIVTKASCASRIRQGMEIRNLKQADLCTMTGISKSTMSQYLSGLYEPSQVKVEIISRALGVTEAWLMGYDTPMDRDAAKKEPALNKRDERDIAKKMEELRDTLKSGDTLMFDGDPMDEETMKYVLDAMEVGLRTAKIINKEKYNPRKNKKD